MLVQTLLIDSCLISGYPSELGKALAMPSKELKRFWPDCTTTSQLPDQFQLRSFKVKFGKRWNRERHDLVRARNLLHDCTIEISKRVSSTTSLKICRRIELRKFWNRHFVQKVNDYGQFEPHKIQDSQTLRALLSKILVLDLDECYLDVRI